MRQKLLDKPILTALISGTAIGLLGQLLSALFLRNLSLLLFWKPEFMEIFRQLRDAQISFPTLAAIGGSAALSFPIAMLWNKRPGTAALLWAVLLLGVFMAAFLFSEVNGVRFWDVLASLIPLVKGGVL